MAQFCKKVLILDKVLYNLYKFASTKVYLFGFCTVCIVSQSVVSLYWDLLRGNILKALLMSVSKTFTSRPPIPELGQNLYAIIFTCFLLTYQIIEFFSNNSINSRNDCCHNRSMIRSPSIYMEGT